VISGAGIIIVDSGGKFDVRGTGHFEGLVILRGTGAFTGKGTGSIFGSTITIEHDNKTANLDGTVDILYSGTALDNLKKIGGLRAITLTSWKDTSLIEERTAEVNRLQKTLEGANIRLSSVATDIMVLLRKDGGTATTVQSIP